ncbi:UNVERIFIED_CONTAM: thiazole synthase ThiGH ThiG subunit [Pseudacidovorax intermedius]|nr:thiazole synthase ThiGH ThiG subunit [Pseudacidovorax intermedius]
MNIETLTIAGRTFNSRLFLGTGKFGSPEIMTRSIIASESQMVTMALKTD